MNYKHKILIIEDEAKIAGFISTVLSSNGYETIIASSGNEGISMISSHCPDLVVLDLGLPDMNGIDIIKFVREWSLMPIVVVSAHMHEREKVAALDAGADDYITKPFGISELMARIRTALRHAQSGNADAQTQIAGVFQAKGLKIDYNKHQVTLDGEYVKLTNNEYKLLSLLGMNPGKVLTYEFILNRLWGPGHKGGNQILRVHMANLRHKIEKNPAEPEYIYTEIGVGYRMCEND